MRHAGPGTLAHPRRAGHEPPLLPNLYLETFATMRIYVGNLSFDASEDDVRQAFSAHGEVSSVILLTDRQSDQHRGFGFVEMPNNEEALKAIAAVHETEIAGQSVYVKPAPPRPDRGPGGGGPGGAGGGGDSGL